MTKQEILDQFRDINYAYNDCTKLNTLSNMLDELMEAGQSGWRNTMELTIRDYYKAAQRTINPALTWEQTRNHALHGIAGECGEIHSLYQKTYQGHELIKERVMDEAGDLMWFVMELCFAEGIDPQEMLEYNVDKLRKRYPGGFDPERSIHREA